MIGISFQLRRAAFIASGQQRRGGAAQRRSGREEKRLAGHAVFRLFDVGNNFLGRLKHTTAQACQRQRSAHQFQKRAPLKWVVPFFSVLRILALDELTKLRRVCQLLETAPVTLAGRAEIRTALLCEDALTHQLEIYVSVFRHCVAALPLSVRKGSAFPAFASNSREATPRVAGGTPAVPEKRSP
jgi:hypothetical protein